MLTAEGILPVEAISPGSRTSIRMRDGDGELDRSWISSNVYFFEGAVVLVLVLGEEVVAEGAASLRGESVVVKWRFGCRRRGRGVMEDRRCGDGN